MPLLSCILLSHLFLMPLQLSAIVILFSELVPTLFDTEFAVFLYFFIFYFFYSPMLTTTSFSYLTLPFFQQGYSIVSLFHLSLYVDSPVSELSNYPCSSFFLELFWLNPSMFLFFFSKDTSMFYIIPGHCTHCYSFRKALNSYSSAHVGNSKLN